MLKRVLFAAGAMALLVTSVGCASRCGNAQCGQCNQAQCRQGHCGLLGGRHGGGGGLGGGGGFGQGGPGGPGGGDMYSGGPPTPTVVYPYYTTRGPRDFLSANPRGIGP